MSRFDVLEILETRCDNGVEPREGGSGFSSLLTDSTSSSSSLSASDSESSRFGGGGGGFVADTDLMDLLVKDRTDAASTASSKVSCSVV